MMTRLPAKVKKSMVTKCFHFINRMANSFIGSIFSFTVFLFIATYCIYNYFKLRFIRSND